jgi:hypothetical protein
MLEGEVYRCLNHPDRAAVGKCNDCGESFCKDCLNIYNLNTGNESAVLYLCPTCLRKRNIEKADRTIIAGIFFSLFGLFSTVLFLPIGIIIILVGLGMVIYGFSQKSEANERSTPTNLQAEEEKRKAELMALEGFDSEEAYNKLLTYYVYHWGPRMGTELLESEIVAYTRCGVSFPEAVKKIYKRQEQKLQNI